MFFNLLLNSREAVEDYAVEIERVGDEIFAHLSLLMGVERDFLRRMHGDVKQGIRMNYYPSCAQPDLVLGVSPHSDSSSITLLVQDDEITALQIKHDGLWVPVRPIPSAIVVNIGDVMEVYIHCGFIAKVVSKEIYHFTFGIYARKWFFCIYFNCKIDVTRLFFAIGIIIGKRTTFAMTLFLWDHFCG